MNNILESLPGFYQKDPNDPFILYGMAFGYMSEKELNKALDFFQILLQQEPGYAPVAFSMLS